MNTTYIDEAGNTGGDIWSSVQPYFVIAGITIPDSNKEQLAAFIGKEYAENKVNTEKELKTKTWVKTAKKRKSLERIVNKIAELHSGLSVVIVEKRFMEAALIVDTFFDGAYNDIQDYSWCNNPDLKKATADYYYDRLDDNDLIFIAKTIVEGGDVLDYQDCLNRVIAVTDKDYYLAMLEGSRSHLLEICDADDGVIGFEEGLRRHILKSPNYTAFYAVCKTLAKQCIISGETTDIVFDSASMCNREFESLYNHFSKAERDAIIPSLIEMYTWKDRLKSFSVEESKNNICLLAADILATSLFNTFTKLQKGEELYRYDVYMLGLFITLLQNEELIPVASSKFYTLSWNAISHYSEIISQLKE